MKRRIAIIGAGAAGLAAGHRLRKLGYSNVHIYEKSRRVGGKCSTIDIEGRSYEMGAVVVGMKTYHVVKELIAEFDCHLMPANRVGLFDVGIGGALKGWPLVMAYLSRGRPAMNKFLKVLKDIPHHRTPGYLAFDSDEFGKTFMEWAAEHDQLGIEEMIAPGFVGWGYQYLEKVPAAYVFKLYDYERTHYGFSYRPFRGSPMQTIREGYGELWNRVAKDLTVFLDTAITRIERGDVVTVETSEGTQEYDDLIIACPFEGITAALQLGDEEEELFNKIEFLNLHTFTARVPDMGKYDLAFFSSNLTADRIGRPVGAFHRWRDSDIWVYYSLGTDSQTPEELESLLRQDLEACGCSVNEVLRHEFWRYFPHVSPQEFKEGFYHRMEGLQGINRTYYGGEIMGFSAVEGSASYSYALVDRFFGEGA